jgi:hypothetical protein
MKTAWQTFGHILVNQLGLSAEAFPLYTTRYQSRAKRLLCQMLRDGHGGRPAMGQKMPQDTAVQLSTPILLMKRFPWERPASNRFLQKGYTLLRLLFETIQMAKLFPGYAWNELMATFGAAIKSK